MPRKHLFPLVVLLAAAVVAGLLALTRTVDLGRPASASTGSDPAIAFRLQELDRFESSLRSQLAEARPAAGAAAPRTVYRRAASPAPAARSHEEDEHEDEGRDD